MLDAHIKPELEIFDLGMANMAIYLLERGLVKPPLYANLLLGNLATAQADFLEIGALVSKLPPGTLWSLAGMGQAQLPVAAMAAAAAPGIRIGLEDNFWLNKERTHHASNLDLVERVHRITEILGRKIMSPAEARQKLGLAPGLRLKVDCKSVA